MLKFASLERNNIFFLKNFEIEHFFNDPQTIMQDI